MTHILKKLSILSSFSLAFLVTLATLSYADKKDGIRYGQHGEYKVLRHSDAYRYIKAESQYNNSDPVIVPVRHSRLGDQVYVPNHGWAYCEYTCALTVQRLHLDFWEDQAEQGGAVSPGIAFDFLTKGYTKRDIEQYEREEYKYRR